MQSRNPALVGAVALCALVWFSGTALAATVNSVNAKYDARKGEVKVSGELAVGSPATLVRLYDDVTNNLLASGTFSEKYKFTLGDSDAYPVPCAVRVEAGAAPRSESVRSAPADCSQFDGTSLTLSGVVRDNPIPFATVTVTVGGVTYTTVADANGEFVIEIAGIDLSSLVLIESTGPNPTDETRTVDMASIAGTLAKLVEDADSDGIVDGTENPNINNTPYTTALFVLVGEANGGETPTTLEELQNAERSVDATELLQLAAVIKLIVDEGYALPIDPSTGQPYETIIGFLADAEVDGGGNTPVENFIATNDAAIETAVAEILTDNEITPAFTTAGIPDRYYLLIPAQVGFLSRNGRAYDFDSQTQTGEIRGVQSGGSNVALPGEFNWQVNDGQLVLDWTEHQTGTYYLWSEFNNSTADQTLRCREPAHPQFDSCVHTCADYQAAWVASGYEEFLVTDTVTQTELTRYAISGGGTREFASQTDLVQREIHDLQVDYDGAGGNPAETFQFCPEIESYTRNLELLDATVNPPKRLEVADFADNTLAVSIIYDPDGAAPAFQETLFMDFVTLINDAPDGDGYRSTSTLLSGTALDWRIVDDGDPELADTTDSAPGPDGNELQFRYASGVQQTLKQLEPTLDPTTAYWVEITGVAQPYGLYEISLWVDPAFQFTEQYLVNQPGEYWNPASLNTWSKDQWQTNGSGQLEILPGLGFGWEFEAGGVGWNPQDAGNFSINFWEVLAAPLAAIQGPLSPLPAGTVRIRHNNNRDRFWIPIANTSVLVPADVANAPTPRERFYALELRYHAFNGALQVAPRINAEEIFYKTYFPWYIP